MANIDMSLFIFAKMQSVIMKVTDIHTHTSVHAHKHTCTEKLTNDKVMAICEIADLPKKNIPSYLINVQCQFKSVYSTTFPTTNYKVSKMVKFAIGFCLLSGLALASCQIAIG